MNVLMKKSSQFSGKVIWILATVLVVVVIHHFLVRPWFIDWGSTARLKSLDLPGDRFTATKGHTRAVLIHATPAEIWPWILQMGQERGGMYSYAWLENMIFANIHNVYELRDELQAPRVKGDTIWLADPDRYSGQGFQILAMIIPQRAFVMVGGDDYRRILRGERALGTWAIYLEPESESSTWLIARSSGNYPLFSRSVSYVFFEVPHFIMERKMLQTIGRLAETTNGHRAE
jgi:hypothetical protein